MRYERALLVAEEGESPVAALAHLRRTAPGLALVVIVTRAPEDASEPPPADAPALEAAAALHEAARRVARSVEVHLVLDLEPTAVAAVAIEHDVELLVAGSHTRKAASLLRALRRRLALPVLWPPAARATDVPTERILCAAIGRGSMRALAAFLRTHVAPPLHVTVLAADAPAPDEVEAFLGVAAIHTKVDVRRSALGALRRWLRQAPRDRALDLVVITRMPPGPLLALRWPAPLLILPADPQRERERRALDVADVVDTGGPLTLRVGLASVVGAPTTAAGVPIAVVVDGRILARATTSMDGEASLAAGLDLASFGVLHTRGDAEPDVVTALDCLVAVVTRRDRPVILYDPELDDGRLVALSEGARSSTPAAEAIAVRLRPTRTVRAIKDRLRSLSLPPLVLDARAVLDEGAALDVSEWNDPVRLERVALRLAHRGFPVASVLHRRLSAPRMPTRADAPPVPGNLVDVELDNPTGRRWLLDAIAASRASLCLQVYMGLDDDVGRLVESALRGAADRGVEVRVLVDSLHGWHGSFGTENPLFQRLAGHPGVEVRSFHPVRELPTVKDLKQRNHCKVLVADGRVALVGGRNLSHEYYTGFEEVHISPRSSWRDVPWLDASVRVEGPAVAGIAQAFVTAWQEAGGAAFELPTPGPAGEHTVRVVGHRGLRDTNILDTYLELVDGAREWIRVVNGFPLLLELQKALLRALQRGVRVRVLSGHLVPIHSGRPFDGAWSSGRNTATEFVHSRLDALIEADAEVSFFARRDVPGWDASLGVVEPHVHAKVLSVDGTRCTVGSANLDVTSSYWESELIVLVEDAELTAKLDRTIDELVAGSVRCRREDPDWQRLSARRAWMRRWPGVLSL